MPYTQEELTALLPLSQYKPIGDSEPNLTEILLNIAPFVDYTMNRAEALEDIKKYYANLLILQYRNKPKAQATIKIGCDIYTGNGLLFDFEYLLDIDNATGYTLDLIGKILGVSRMFVSDTPNVEFFTFDTKGETTNGFSTIGAPSNGIFKRCDINYYDKNALSDTNFRIILKLKAIMNSVRSTWADLDRMYYTVFGDDLYFENNNDGTIEYFINTDNIPADVISAIKQQGLLKAPLGVSYTINGEG